ncbi:MAG TPA: DinB family protein [Longimicrobiales bacterium]|nr:DinB family protein [Longimicrobiales bacterium]
MSRVDTLLEEALEAWGYARDGVLDEASNIPDDDYDWRPHDDARSVRELLLHILESGLVMSGELTRPDGDFQRLSFPQLIAEHAAGLPVDADPPRLRTLLKETLDRGTAAFRAAGEIRMLQRIRRFDGELWTRLAWMHHGIAHEEYHRGQLATYARAMGLVPALTRRIHGD